MKYCLIFLNFIFGLLLAVTLNAQPAPVKAIFTQPANGIVQQQINVSPVHTSGKSQLGQMLPGGLSDSDVVINEFMASNDLVVTDPAGEADDWIELYNTSSSDLDISGYYLSDKADWRTKWQFPDSTFITGNGYLIIWADEDGDKDQAGLHANFKLAKSGEEIYFSTPDSMILDEVQFGEQTTDMSYARIPNGSGEFSIQNATFAASNDGTTSLSWQDFDRDYDLFPNPSSGRFTLRCRTKEGLKEHLSIFDPLGIPVYSARFEREIQVDMSQCKSGVYFITINGSGTRLILQTE